MTKLYKLTDENMRTHAGYQWALGEERTASGEGELCGPGWLHAYTDPLLAVLLNPVHANLRRPRLFEAKGVVGKEDRGLKVGCTSLRLVHEIPLPEITGEQRVRFAIFCAREVYHDPWFLKWSNAWLSGADRSYAAGDAAYVAAYAAAYAAHTAVYAADAAEAAKIDFVALARRAMES